MGAASHLGITLRDYDSRIRTFIPDYGEILDRAAQATAAVVRRSPVILDLGTGSGALAHRCLVARPDARIVGIDEDEGMLSMAHARLGGRLTSIAGNFLSARLPRADAVIASFALHHTPTGRRKAALYRKTFAALTPGGVLVSADCFPATDARLRAAGRAAWLAHLERFYTARKASALLAAWAHEDTYFSLDQELAWLRAAGFRAEVVWRRHAFGVILGTKASSAR